MTRICHNSSTVLNLVPLVCSRIGQKEPDSSLQFSFHRDYFSLLSALPGLSQTALMIKHG